MSLLKLFLRRELYAPNELLGLRLLNILLGSCCIFNCTLELPELLGRPLLLPFKFIPRLPIFLELVWSLRLRLLSLRLSKLFVWFAFAFALKLSSFIVGFEFVLELMILFLFLFLSIYGFSSSVKLLRICFRPFNPTTFCIFSLELEELLLLLMLPGLPKFEFEFEFEFD